MIAKYFSLPVLAAIMALPLAAQQSGGTLTLRLLSFTPECEKDAVYLHDPSIPPPTPGGPPSTPGVKGQIKSYLNHEIVTVQARGQRLVITDSADPASAA